MTAAPAGVTVDLEVEAALGPGVDIEHIGGAWVGRRARMGSLWLGLDRAVVPGTDDGQGRLVGAVVALPVSTFAGCRLEAVVDGGWLESGRLVVAAHLPGAPGSAAAVARAVAGVSDAAQPVDAAAALAELACARRRFRERRARGRVLGGKAWLGTVGRVEDDRFTTPHSNAEYRLERLPARFRRGLDGLLDDDERLLYAIERPALRDTGLVGRVVRRVDRRAALLALTDRQLLWIVDHADPDRHLFDWGVDVEIVPIERLVGAELRSGSPLALTITTPAGLRTYRIPEELGPEATVMVRLLHRFLPGAAGTRPRRVYTLGGGDVDLSGLDAFGQADEALAALAAARRDGPVIAALYDPRRPGTRRASLLVLHETGAALRSAGGSVAVARESTAALGLTLSPLLGRLTVVGRGATIDLRFPAPLAGSAAAWLRAARRVVANA